jgi:GNAT superfamily N-acetyltransferase
VVRIELVNHSEVREQMLDLFRVSFRRDMAAELWDWKYLRSLGAPHHPEVVVAMDGGRVVGAAPFVAGEMWVGNRKAKAALHCDSMVHPEYRGAGLFESMGRFALGHLREKGFALAYGFAGPMSHRGTLRQGWQMVVPTEAMFRVLLPAKVLALLLRSRLLGRSLGFLYGALWSRRAGQAFPGSDAFEVRVLDRFSDRLREVDGLRTGCKIELVRDEEYLRWRFDSHPEHGYRYVVVSKGGRLRGYAVISVEERENGLIYGDIVDYVTADQDGGCLRVLVNRCLEVFEEAGCALAQTWAFSEPVVGRELARRFGFKSVSSIPCFKLLGRGYLDAVLIDPKCAPAVDIYDKHNWRVTPAYLDIR